VKTSELTGVLLDYWVAKAEGLMPAIGDGACYLPQGGAGWYRPSGDWAHGGPIIECADIALRPTDHPEDPNAGIVGGRSWWLAHVPGGNDQRGNTPLESAMRAYVASKFGEEVPDSTEIQNG
jgi:hypothetical protein